MSMWRLRPVLMSSRRSRHQIASAVHIQSFRDRDCGVSVNVSLTRKWHIIAHTCMIVAGLWLTCGRSQNSTNDGIVLWHDGLGMANQ